MVDGLLLGFVEIFPYFVGVAVFALTWLVLSLLDL